MNLFKNHRVGIAAIAAFSLLAGVAQATHWPQAGADSGRSGHQTADQAALPMKFRGLAGTNDVQTSPLITAGTDISTQNVAYGFYQTANNNRDGKIGLWKFSAPATPVAAAADIDDESPRDGLAGSDDPDQFGPAGDVTPMEASLHSGGPTDIFAVHNDDNQTGSTPGADPGETSRPNPQGNDLAIAQIKSSTGALVRDVYIGSPDVVGGANTNGMTIESAPVMGPDLGGSREVYFTASRVSGTPSTTTKHLVKVVVEVGAAADDTSVLSGLVISPNIADLNLRARIALATLSDPSDDVNVAMAVLPTTNGLKSVRLSDPELDDFGPSISGLGTTWSPSIPVQANGNVPAVTPFLYVAGSTAEGTILYKLKQGAGGPGDPSLATFELAEGDGQSPELAGKPGPALSLAQVIPTSGPGSGTAQPGRVIVTTGANLYSLDTENLSADDPPQLFESPAATAFSKTAAATSGNLGFAVTDGGSQFAFFLTPVNGELAVPREEEGFEPNSTALNSTASLGQPAISRGRVVFGANNGAFVYGANVSILQPVANGNVSGSNVTLEAFVADATLNNVTFKIDGTTVGSDNTLESNRASITWNSLTVLDGPHAVIAEASDGVVTEASAQRVFIVNNFANPTATLTASPNPGNVGQDVTLNASGSAPTPGENETIAKYEYEIDGDNDFNDAAQNAAIVKVQFTTPGVKTLRVRVTDSHGDTAIAEVKNYRVNAPPEFTLKATPNPATAGQAVEIDATASDSDGSIAKYEFDLDGNDTFELDNGTNPKTSKAFTATTKVSARVTDNEGGQTIKSITVTVPPANKPPVASFIVAPNPAKAGQDVGFSAAASKDPEGGPITKYEWDFDGNGTFEVNNGTNPLLAHKFAKAGVFKVALRVTDNAGLTGTATVDVIVSGVACTTSTRCRPRLTAKVSPKRDRKLPYVFTTRGRVGLPTGLAAADACKGRVRVQVKVGRKTISSRRARVRSTCRFTSKVTFKNRKRLGRAKSLRFSIRFQGNKLLSPRSTSVKTVRIG